MSRVLDEQFLLQRSRPQALALSDQPLIKKGIVYTGVACVAFALVMVGVFVGVIAYDLHQADRFLISVTFPVKVVSRRSDPLPIFCHLNPSRLYNQDVVYRPVDIPGKYCSHLVLPMRGFLSAGNDTFDVNSAFVLMQNRLVELRDDVQQTFPHLKHVVAIGPENDDGRLPFHEAHNASVYMSVLVEMVRWLLETQFHGIVLNRVLPLENEFGKHMVGFLKRLKQVMHKHRVLFIATARSDAHAFTSSIKPRLLPEIFDYVIVKTQVVNHTASSSERILVPFYQQRSRTQNSIEGALKQAIRRGVPKSHVLVAVSLSGFMCTLSAPPANNVVPSWGDTQTKRVVSYKEACQLVRTSEWRAFYDEESERPYAWHNNLWMAYEDEMSVRKMASLVHKMSLGGVVIVDVGHDDYQGQCGVANPLVRAVFGELEGTLIDDNSSVAVLNTGLASGETNGTLTVNATRLHGPSGK
ncbi:chitinase-3-like protein 2 [Haemaphysalis longicornis]|uniref:GH18 domain-containing protein n=1 Tax=Haemaphysalis longicornis TaxID=44386 RepID=A0A9J6FAY6_HAELO|nr:hypothetical protein HPB48_003131 [Haemaphysalis longicornis]